MGKNSLKSIIFGAIFIIGLIILMNSINFGNNEVSNILKANGGSMSGDKYLIYLEQSIEKYKFVGSILSMLGGIGVIITTSNKSQQ